MLRYLLFLIIACCASLQAADRSGLKAPAEVTVWRTLVAIAKEGPAAKDAEAEIAGLMTETWEGRRRTRFCYYALTKITGNAAAHVDRMQGLIGKTFPAPPGMFMPEYLALGRGPALPDDLTEASDAAWECCLDVLLPRLWDSPKNMRESQALEQTVRKMAVPPRLLVPRCIKVMADVKRPEVQRVRAIYQIGSCGPWEGSVQPLLTAMGDTNVEVRARATYAMGFLGHPATVISGSRPPYPHPAKAKALVALKKALKDPEKLVRQLAAGALGSMYDEATDAIPEITTAYATEADSTVRKNLATALTNTASPTAIPHLLKIMKDPDPSVRAQNLRAIGSLASELKKPDLFTGIKSAIEKQMATEMDAGVREAMESALKSISAGK